MGRKALNPDKCTKCGGDGPFDRDKRKLSGHSSWCRACKRVGTNENAAKNRDRNNKRNKEWYATHKDIAKKHSEEWKAAHPTYFNDKASLWRLAHLERARTNTRNRQARKRGAKGTFTANEWETLKAEYDNRCAYCNKQTERLQADHIIPLSRGGTNYISNIVPACGSCNASKNDVPLLIWLYSKVGDLPSLSTSV